jgi:predicted phage tail protein
MSDALAIYGAGGGGGGGKGGGGGGQRTPTEAGDNLNSTQYAKVLDLLSEGEIEGLKDGLKSVYLDNVPIINADNTPNFYNYGYDLRTGTQAQDYIPGTNAVENEVPVGVTVALATPVTRTITDATVNAVRVTISIPALQHIQDNGDINGTGISVVIRVQYAGGSFVDHSTNIIEGRTADLYQRSFLVELSGAFPVNIRVLRATADSGSAKLQNAFSWASYTEITYAKLRYPNSALIGLRFNAEQFSRIPQRSYLIRGIKIRIPSNATVDQNNGRLIYNGIWNGSFQSAQWCSDPAWILYDLLLSKRYGVGDHIDAAQLDKFAFYSASVYASALVPDGLGGQEPRFSCNTVIQTSEDVYKLINDLCSTFRAMPYWANGTLTLSQDRPTDPAYLFTNANVSEEGFTYAGSSLKNRPNVAVVGYFDYELKDTAYEVVEDQDSIQKYGVVIKQITAYACTSRAQAARLGEWLLYSEQNEGEVINFTASIEAGIIVRPGQIIEVADRVRTTSRRGGRISSATTAAITLDSAAGLTAGGATLSVIMPDGTVGTRNISTIVGNVVTLGTTLPVAPNVSSIWIYETSALQPSTWRVISVQEQDGMMYAISALAYNSSKYDYVERGRPLQTRTISNLNQLLEPPTTVNLSETLYTYQSQVRAKIIASWPYVDGAIQYRVRWRKDLANWNTAEPQSNQYEILDITPGTFEVEVRAINSGLKQSPTAATASINALGKTAPPSNVTGFTSVIDPNIGVTLEWNLVTDLDLSEYEIRQGASWEASTFVTRVSATSYKLGQLASNTSTYQIKAIDTSDIYSTTAASTTVTIVSPSEPVFTLPLLSGAQVILNWTATPGSLAVAYYDVRYGASFASGQPIGRFNTTTTTINGNWIGLRTFWITAVDIVGNSSTAGTTSLTISAVPAPTISTLYTNDSLTLSWSPVAGSLPTIGYEIRQGSTYEGAAVLGRIEATAYTQQANFGTTPQRFWVAGINSNGDLGTPAYIDTAPAVLPAVNPSSAFAGEQVRLSWTAVPNNATRLEVAYYQIRRCDTGVSFAAATIIAETKSTVYAFKVNWLGTQRFWVAAYDSMGNAGTPTFTEVVISKPAAPTITQQVIDNNVLLRWNDVTQSLPIIYYEVRRGAVWASATSVGTKQGLFTTIFETVSGNFTYWIAGIDSAGNIGTESSVNAIVSQPPDYVLRADINSTFSGTGTNVISNAGGLLATVDTTETWQTHFTSRSWTTPQDQINAGYSIYALPSTTTGSYVEEIDYGAVLAGTRVTSTLTHQSVIGSVTITPTISVRQTSGSAWIDYANVESVYATSFRYVKVTYDFTSSGNDDLLQISALNIRLDVKIISDLGNGTANAGDTGGTTVNFNIAFADIESIIVTPSGTAAHIAVYDFVDAPNPTSFKVLLFDTSGNRVTGAFSWQARGS